MRPWADANRLHRLNGTSADTTGIKLSWRKNNSGWREREREGETRQGGQVGGVPVQAGGLGWDAFVRLHPVPRPHGLNLGCVACSALDTEGVDPRSP